MIISDIHTISSLPKISMDIKKKPDSEDGFKFLFPNFPLSLTSKTLSAFYNNVNFASIS